METEVQRLLEAVVDLRERANVNAVFGAPVTVEGRTVIPVAQVAYGFGMGIGNAPAAEEGTAEEAAREVAEGASNEGKIGGVGGGGVLARPFAVIEVTPEGTRVESVVDEQKVALATGLLVGWAVFWLARALVKIFGRQA